MKVAIVGTGIAGNTVAWSLREQHDITVYEDDCRSGGHSFTVDVDTGYGNVAIDTGFIVFNDRTYPEFNRLLDAIGQDWQASEMSFSVKSPVDDIEYNGASLNRLFCQRRNLARPSFWRMIRDIVRFNREAPVDAQRDDGGTTLGEYLYRRNYSATFAQRYLVPMAAAIWSANPLQVPDMPLGFLVRFFDNHGLLQLRDRPLWRVIPGGSREYVGKMLAGHRDRIRLSCGVRTLRRDTDGVYVLAGGFPEERYDAVFLGCHSDQALRLLADPTRAEKSVLAALPYRKNEAVLHTDTTVLPRCRRAWAAWNYCLPRDARQGVAVTYNMNLLQGLDTAEHYLVTLNDLDTVHPDRVLRQITFEHPVFDRSSVAAQQRHQELNTGNRTFYCGAYWRNGFHEDGVVSALAAVRHFEEAERHGQLHFRRAG